MKLHNTRDEDIILEAVLACYRERFDEGAEVVTLRSFFLLDPIRNEDVGVDLFSRVAVRAEDDLRVDRRRQAHEIPGKHRRQDRLIMSSTAASSVSRFRSAADRSQRFQSP